MLVLSPVQVMVQVSRLFINTAFITLKYKVYMCCSFRVLQDNCICIQQGACIDINHRQQQKLDVPYQLLHAVTGQHNSLQVWQTFLKIFGNPALRKHKTKVEEGKIRITSWPGELCQTKGKLDKISLRSFMALTINFYSTVNMEQEMLFKVPRN